MLAGSGRKSNQRLKAYLVLQYLLKNSDDEHPAKIDDITDYLQTDCGIDAERRSIYKDIHEINIVSIMLQEGCTFDEAEQMLNDNDELSLVKSKHLHGFYVTAQNRSLTPDDARILAECIYSAKFIPEGHEQFYIDMVCDSLSKHQKKRISHDVLLLDRISTFNRETIASIDIIKDAIPPNQPRKIKFQYLKYTIQNLQKQVERRHGSDYIVSPYAMIIDNGNYYLLGIDERFKDKRLKTFRIDRMRKVKILDEPRTETEETKELDLHDYTRRVFSMFGGKRERVTIRFVNSLLDTVIDRIGTKDAIYSQIDEMHFTVTASVEISDQFYGWVCGFRNKARITAPEWVVKDFGDYVANIANMYQS